MKQTLLFITGLFLAVASFAQGVKVEYQLVNGVYQLYRGGDPYFIRGGAYNGNFMDSIPVYGGNSIRTYSTDSSTETLLDQAHSLGLTVTLGLYAKREADFFNYNDTAAVNAQLEDFRYWVQQYRDHPAVLMWSIGNEADASYTNYALWDAVNDIAEMIHEEDSLHPTMTVLAGAHDVDIAEIKSRAPAIDVLGVNTYRSIGNLHVQLSSNNWNKPYVVTEWGPDGTWETNETSWNAPIEYSSTSKAYIYRTRYQNYISANPIGQCIGSYVFLWGYQEHGEVESWYSTFTINGESTEAIEAMQYVWTGSYPAQRAPRITEMVLNGQQEDDNVTLAGGAVNWAKVDAYDPNSDDLTYEWAIVEEGYDLSDAGPGKSFPELAGLIEYEDADSIAFITPSEKGRYRLYVVVHDGNDKVALMGIPFQVEHAFDMLENYEGVSTITLESSVGTYSEVSNPDRSGLNKTELVGKYVAPGNDPYDKFTFSSGVAVEDAGKFKSGDFKVRMELYTNAPVGTSLQLNFQNAAASTGSYPSGRNSVYKTVTSAQNQWTTVTFDYYNAPDPTISDVQVDQLVFAFDAGTSSAYTYYLDNIRIEKTDEDDLSSDVVFENYETTSTITYLSASGTYEVIANPWPDTDNSSDSTSRYARNPGATYDGLTFLNEQIDDASEYETEEKALAINLYTTAPAGALMEIQLRNDSMFGSYPAGRHSIYQARVLEQNSWHRVIFRHVSSPDSSVPDNLVDRMVFLLSPGTAISDTFYIDNIRSININAEVPSLPAPWQNQDIGTVGLTGSTSDQYSGQVFIVQGSGDNIWDTADQFQYAYRPFSGDGEIICLIPSVSPDIDPYVKAGLMFRESLDDDARHAMVYITPENGNAFQYRASTGGSCIKTSDAASIDRWLKLKRTGNVFEAYQSNDGVSWSLIDSASVSMSNAIYVGLAVTAHDNTKKAKATFRDISIVEGGAGSRQFHGPVLNAEDIEIVLYPNPTRDFINFRVSGKEMTDCVIYDLLGQKRDHQVTFDGYTYKIDVQHFESGIYIVEVVIDGVRQRNLVIKK